MEQKWTVTQNQLAQGLESLASLARNNMYHNASVPEIIGLMYQMIINASRPGVVCLDINHNSDFGRQCTNENCPKSYDY